MADGNAGEEGEQVEEGPEEALARARREKEQGNAAFGKASGFAEHSYGKELLVEAATRYVNALRALQRAQLGVKAAVVRERAGDEDEGRSAAAVEAMAADVLREEAAVFLNMAAVNLALKEEKQATACCERVLELMLGSTEEDKEEEDDRGEGGNGDEDSDGERPLPPPPPRRPAEQVLSALRARGVTVTGTDGPTAAAAEEEDQQGKVEQKENEETGRRIVPNATALKQVAKALYRRSKAAQLAAEQGAAASSSGQEEYAASEAQDASASIQQGRHALSALRRAEEDLHAARRCLPKDKGIREELKTLRERIAQKETSLKLAEDTEAGRRRHAEQQQQESRDEMTAQREARAPKLAPLPHIPAARAAADPEPTTTTAANSLTPQPPAPPTQQADGDRNPAAAKARARETQVNTRNGGTCGGSRFYWSQTVTDLTVFVDVAAEAVRVLSAAQHSVLAAVSATHAMVDWRAVFLTDACSLSSSQFDIQFHAQSCSITLTLSAACLPPRLPFVSADDVAARQDDSPAASGLPTASVLRTLASLSRSGSGAEQDDNNAAAAAASGDKHILWRDPKHGSELAIVDGARAALLGSSPSDAEAKAPVHGAKDDTETEDSSSAIELRITLMASARLARPIAAEDSLWMLEDRGRQLVLHLDKLPPLAADDVPGAEWWDRVFDTDSGIDIIDPTTCNIDGDWSQLPTHAVQRAEADVQGWRSRDTDEVRAERAQEWKQHQLMDQALRESGTAKQKEAEAAVQNPDRARAVRNMREQFPDIPIEMR